MTRLSAWLVALSTYLRGTRLFDSGCLRVPAVLGFLLVSGSALEAQTVVIAATWNANAESNIGGYVLSYGTQTGVYSTSTDVGNVTSWQGPLTSGAGYYFAVKAYNTSLQFSPYSAEIFFFVGVAPPVPSLTSVNPASGAVGTSVTLTGTNFGGTQETSAVTFNGTAATPSSWSATSLVAPVPAGATTGNVVVTVGGQASNAVVFTVSPPVPSLTSVNPASGAVGTSVTLTGTNFGGAQGTSAVTFNGMVATPSSWSATSLVAPVPTGATTGMAVVTVGSQASNGVSFTVNSSGVPAPWVAQDVGGPALAGHATYASGAFSVTAAGVDIWGVNDQFQFVYQPLSGDGQIVALVSSLQNTDPWAKAGVMIREDLTGGAPNATTLVTVGNGLAFQQRVTRGGATTSLSSPAGASWVRLVRSGNTFTAYSSVTGTAWVLMGSMTVPMATNALVGLAVTSHNPSLVTVGTLSNVTVSAGVTPPPSLTSLTPAAGVVGTAVTMAGTNFGAAQGTSTVTFNGIAGTPSSWSGTSLVARVPAGATTGNVVVTVGGQASNAVSFTVSLPPPPPTLTTLNPTSGAVGTSVTITGTNFGGTKGTSTVTFNGTAATPSSWSGTSLVAPVPAGATTGNVVVTVGGQASNAVVFTVPPPVPSLTSVNPASGAVGTSVTLTGTNFGGAQGTSTVTFNGTAATPSSWSATSLVAPVPAGATTGNVVVTVGGQASNAAVFTVPPPVPSLTSVNPASGAVGTSVTLTGTNFGGAQGTSTVTFNGTAATPSSWSATSLVAPVPAGATTGNVVVTVGGQASNAVVFTVPPPVPSLTSVNPASGAVGTSVTLTGTNFGGTQGTSTVTFNGMVATPSSWSATSLVAPVPTGATTGMAVVTVGSQASNGVSFTVNSSGVPAPWVAQDVGGPALAGHATYASGAFSVTAAGVDIWGVNDQFQFVYQPLSGDGQIVALVSSLQNTDPWAKAGVMIREDLTGGAPNATTLVTVGNGLAFQQRVTRGGATTSLSSPAGASWVRLVRSGNTFTAYSSVTGTAWVLMGSMTVPMATNALVGLAVTSHNPSVVTVGMLSNVTVSAGVTPPPSLTSLTPAAGVVGTAVTMAGTNFGAAQGTSTVTFNGIAATPSSWSGTSLVARVPAGATTGNVVVTVGGQASNAVSFTVSLPPPPPTLTTLNPTSGAVGTSVTITGTNFGGTKGTSTVTFNGTAATPSSWSGTSLVAPVPAGATTGNVVVTVGGQASNAVVFTVPPPVPSLTSVNPASGAVGTSVTLTGTNFGGTQGTSTVTFNGTPATPTSWSVTSISALVPAGATTGNVVVTVGSLASNAVTFTVNPGLPAPWTAQDVGGPALAGSATYTSGTFSVTGGGVDIFGVSDQFQFVYQRLNGDGSIVALVNSVQDTDQWAKAGVMIRQDLTGGAPNAMSAVTVFQGMTFQQRVTAGGTSIYNNVGFSGAAPYWVRLDRSGNTFTGYYSATGTTWSLMGSVTVPMATNAYVGLAVTSHNPSAVTVGTFSNVTVSGPPAPSLTTVSPASGTVGMSVTLTGTNFGLAQGISTVTFNGTAATPTGWSVTSISAPVPSGATTGNVMVTVGGQVSNAVPFIVTLPPPPPSLTAVTPTSGAVGTSVTLSGTNFGATKGTSSVMFNGTAATPTSWSATSIVVPVPSGATTGNVVVTVGVVASNGVSFTVIAAAPSLTSLNPTSGVVGTSVTITGTSFGGAQGTGAITFNGTAATPTSWSPTSLVVPVPTGATTGNVVVTVGGVASNALTFTIIQTAVVTATWNANTESDIGGYALSFGTQTGVYTTSTDVGNLTSWQGPLAQGVGYYFAVKAYNTSLQFSPYSTEVFFQVATGLALTQTVALRQTTAPTRPTTQNQTAAVNQTSAAKKTVSLALGARDATLATPTIIDPTLAAFWQLNDGIGTTAFDASGGGMNGRLVNGPVWTAGRLGGALRFDGINAHVTTNFVENLTTWTVAAWVRSPDAPSSASGSGPVDREKNFQINWNHTDAALRGAVALSAGGTWYAASFGPLAANTWYHLVGTYDGETLRAYVNGVLATANPVPSSNPDLELLPLELGARAGAASYFAGVVNGVRIYRSAISAAEVAALAHADATPPTAVTLSASPNGQAVSLSWTAAADLNSGVSVYRIYRGTTAGGTKSPLAEGLANALRYRDLGTAPFTTYYYEVGAVNGNGIEGLRSNEAVVVTGETAPAAGEVAVPVGP